MIFQDLPNPLVVELPIPTGAAALLAEYLAVSVGVSERFFWHGPHVLLIRNRDNIGFARASNQGAAASRGRYVVLLNPDTEVLPGALANLVAFADAHPDAGVVGCAHFSPDGRQVDSFARGHFFPKTYRSTRVERLRKGWVSGARMLLRRSACEAVGWLNESFFFGCEDVEICWRMNKAGWRVYYVPDARIIHHGGASSRANPRVLLENRKNRRAMVRMHSSPWVYRLWSAVASVEEWVQRARLRGMGVELGAFDGGSEAPPVKRPAASRGVGEAVGRRRPRSA